MSLLFAHERLRGHREADERAEDGEVGERAERDHADLLRGRDRGRDVLEADREQAEAEAEERHALGLEEEPLAEGVHVP